MSKCKHFSKVIKGDEWKLRYSERYNGGEKKVDNNKNKLIDLYKIREKLEGTRICIMILCLADSQFIFNKNYQELSKAIGEYEKNWLTLMAVKNRQKFEGYMRELKRLFHNYVLSIFSLIEHTQAFLKELNNSKLNNAYKIKLEKLQRNKCVYFVKDLRHYTQHKELPMVTAHISATRPTTNVEFEFKQNLLLMKKNLLRWKSWKENSKRYISQYKGDIDLKVVISEYNTLVTKFYNWLYKRVLKLYSKELKELAKIELKIKRLESYT